MAKKLDIDIEEVYQLASKGYSVTMICSAIGIDRSTAYKQSHIINTIKRGADKAKQDVVDHLMQRSIEDQGATASIFLAKQLKVFSIPYPTSQPKTPTEATKRISKIYIDVSRGELDEEKGNALVSYLQAYIKSYEVSDLENRITALESLNEK